MFVSRSITESSAEEVVQGPSVLFGFATLVSVAYSFLTFIVAVVHFSDPLLDPSFNSKLRFLGFVLLLTQLPLVAVRIDFWTYVRNWKYMASQVILQVRLQDPSVLRLSRCCLWMGNWFPRTVYIG